ncbi:type I polyketide synthase [Novipirellula artificiosorum]|uniref:Phthiocerol synthesis polyketide synthase type I PpsE n=1 Tax=Novipirellula artificiosorum TaxID=2528016 RepID=A0A5C6DE69_9BACT|nr:type I polyketide synthase [Novipirellula artificiosorum]TWU34948.1 Phthiocerol synthesis polyketide synthase type I PpsE [Novipirellula artificiosorum]
MDARINAMTLAVSSTFTAEPICLPLSVWLRELHEPFEIKFSPYGQVLQSLIDPRSVLIRDGKGFNVLLIRLQDWTTSSSAGLADRGRELSHAAKAFARQSASPTLICFCPSSPDIHDSLLERTGTVEQQLISDLSSVSGIYVIPSSELMSTYPVGDYFDKTTYRTAHIPYSRAFFIALGTMVARRLHAIRRRPTKVIVLDCDNTLWHGACGELGSQGVCVDKPFEALQSRMIQLREQGVLLALCSKNREQDVWDVFDHNQSMLLRQEQIAAAEINWNPKSKNLRSIAQKLGLGLESLILLDDNPIEIAEVRSNCPSVLALQLPSPSEIPAFLDHVWALDRPKITEDDLQRAESYRIESSRREARQASVSMRQFLTDLELQVRFLELDEVHLERVSQLTQRTNQFNCSLIRRTSSELRHFLLQPNHFGFAFEVSDKFGDYGLVGVNLCHQQDRNLRVDTFLLSCRALGRGVEHQMLRHLGSLANRLNLGEVIIPFVQGERNEPAAAFFATLGKPFASERGDEVEYRFPSARLLQIDPLSAADGADAKNEAAETDSASHETEAIQADSVILNRIATEFQSVEPILKHLATHAAPRPDLSESYIAAVNAVEIELSKIGCEILHLKQVGVNDSLHDLGATSLHIVQIHSQIITRLGVEIPITELYALATIREIAERLSGIDQANALPPRSQQPMTIRSQDQIDCSDGIAVIGMSGRFPGADDVSQFWKNLLKGVNSIKELSEEELNLPSDSPLRQHPGLVRKAATVNDADKFDSRFFGIFPKEAQVMDPQHRLMLECSWHALEDAGYCPDAIKASVGVFAGCYMNTYTLASLASNPALLESLANSFHGGDLLIELGNDKDYLATRVSFLLNLRGPSLTIQTACSTSLVATVQACLALQSHQCDMALAGGSTLKFPQKRGYLYSDGGMVSPDGVCRTFDADARGTVFGEGVGVVVLKRVEDAVADGDDIYGVIRGWGINNDGHSKMGYTAPSVEGQSAAIRMAHQQAGITADSITYIEAHGTGTALGDPIEVDSLTKAFRDTTDGKQFCAIGSLKSNIGHLDVAAGVTGIIKICQSLRHEVIPPSLNFKRPNPNIDFENSPFYVVTKRQDWKRGTAPRRAGLSSFGVGGTNAHIVVEEAPNTSPSASPIGPQLIVLSARSQHALDQMTTDLADCLTEQPDLNLADVAYTLQVGRKTQNYSRIAVADSLDDARQSLVERKSGSVFTAHQVRRGVPIAFMFPGQGAQHVNMARGLYETDPLFRGYFDDCCELLAPHLEFDLKEKIFVEESESARTQLNQTTIAQPAIFAVSYSIAKRLEDLGIVPDRMIGHSVGEFVAACLAGVYSLPDALRLIAFRAKSMQQLPPGSMLAVRVAESEILARIANSAVELAAINGPSLCVVAGPTEAIEQLQQQLDSEELPCRSLHTSHAFHSEMMQPAVEPMAEMLKSIPLSEPTIPIISSVTGQLLTAQQATDPNYWALHLRKTVRFTDAMEELLTQGDSSLLEVGAGQTLSTLARQHPSFPSGRTALSSLPHAKASDASARHFVTTLGRLWLAGTDLDWASLHSESRNSESQPRHVRRRRVHLPTYRFERKRFWFDETKPEPPPVPSAHSGTLRVQSRSQEAPSVEAPSVEAPSVEAPSVEAPSVEEKRSAAELSANQISAATGPNQGQDEVVEHVIRQQLQLMQQQLRTWNP